MKIGILQCGHVMDEVKPRFGDLTDLFQRLLAGNGFEFVTFDVVDMVFPALEDADGWLLTGSRYGVYEDHDFIPPLEQLIRDLRAKAAPIVGICFGHQLIAQALGGTVTQSDKGWAIGPHTYGGPGGDITINAWHQDQVLTPPQGAQTILASDFCPFAGLAYGDDILTYQAHPEFPAALVAEYARRRQGTGTYPDALMDAAQTPDPTPTQGDAIGREIAAFFLSHAQVPHG